MNRYKDILVDVALDDYDHTLAEYASLVAFMSGADRVRFVHVQPPPIVVDELYPEYAAHIDQVSEEMRTRLETLAEDEFHGPTNVEVRSTLVSGNPLAELLRLARDESPDLLIVGQDHDGGTLAEKLARKAPCSVLIVPNKVPAEIRRVLVPVDFSDHAADALDVASAFADAAGLSEVHALHVFRVPPSYLKLGKTYPRVQADIAARARERLDAFLEGLSLHGLRAVGHVVDGDDTHQTIHGQIRELGADMVVIGTRGRTATAAVLLGSVAEQTVRSSPVPVVAVKQKGATLSLLNALFEP